MHNSGRKFFWRLDFGSLAMARVVVADSFNLLVEVFNLPVEMVELARKYELKSKNVGSQEKVNYCRSIYTYDN